jgi:hypothetical protein
MENFEVVMILSLSVLPRSGLMRIGRCTLNTLRQYKDEQPNLRRRLVLIMNLHIPRQVGPAGSRYLHAQSSAHLCLYTYSRDLKSPHARTPLLRLATSMHVTDKILFVTVLTLFNASMLVDASHGAPNTPPDILFVRVPPGWAFRNCIRDRLSYSSAVCHS